MPELSEAYMYSEWCSQSASKLWYGDTIPAWVNQVPKLYYAVYLPGPN